MASSKYLQKCLTMALASILLDASKAFAAIQCHKALSPFEASNLLTTKLPEAPAKTLPAIDLQTAGAHSGYSYTNYKGPRNMIHDIILKTQPHALNPRLANVGLHGKVFSFYTVAEALGVMIEGADQRKDMASPEYFIDRMDEVASISPRARYHKTSGDRNAGVQHWILNQYPELAEPIRELREQSKGPSDIGYHQIPTSAIEKWLTKYPQYRQGLLIFPRPSLWNRVAQLRSKIVYSSETARSKKQALNEAIEAGKEYFIEDIASLLNPHLAEVDFDRLKPLLVRLSGPHTTRITQTQVLKTITQWVLTQYPELSGLASGSQEARDKDALSQRYGRTLSLIPVEWATGDLKTLLPEGQKLTQLPSYWETQVLPRILQLLRGQAQPRIREKHFELRDPVTKQRRALRTGDEVKMSFLPQGEIYGDMSRLNYESIDGIVESVIIENGKMVGFMINRWKREDSNPLSPVIGLREDLMTYWLRDFESEDSRIIKSGGGSEKRIDVAHMTFPEDSGEAMIRVGQRGSSQAPLSVGDVVDLYRQNPQAKYPEHLDMIITGFDRDADGKVVALRGYEDRNFRFKHMSGLNRSENGMPVSMEHTKYNFDQQRNRTAEVTTTSLNSSYKEVTVPINEVRRLNDATRFYTELTAFSYFRLPQSRIRKPFDHVSNWTVSKSKEMGVREDSQDFMLPIGRNENNKPEQTSISGGDEVLLHVYAPGTFLGFHYDRVLVSGIVMENGKAIGIRGQRIGSSTEDQIWLFKDIEIGDSYIETQPWFGGRANSIPGAFEKRVPLNRSRDNRGFADRFREFFQQQKNHGTRDEEAKDIFGYRFMRTNESVETPPWTSEPLDFDVWLEQNNLANTGGVKRQWAYWVLQANDKMTDGEVIAQYRIMVKKFSANTWSGSDNAAKNVSTAFKSLNVNRSGVVRPGHEPEEK
jgi:hypothetical protein